MKGYIARKRDRYYAVIYEGIDPVTGKEKRSWHPAGTNRADAEALAARLAAERDGANDAARTLTFGAYLTGQWLPAKKLSLATTTYRGYVHNCQRHILPALGSKRIRRLRPQDLERLYDTMLHPTDDRAGLAPKTVYEVHLIIRGALDAAVKRGIVSRNIALIAAAPGRRSIPKTEGQSWTAQQLQQFLAAAATHRLFPALWLTAATGMRRNELLGLRWSDLDTSHRRLSINRGLVAIGYELHNTRCKTPTSRRCIDLDPTTITILEAWQAMQHAEHLAAGVDNPDRWMFTTATGERVHPHAVSQAFERVTRRARLPVIRLHDLRHTHGSLLIAAGIPAKVVSERLGHARSTFTIETYQHVLPGMGAHAATTFEDLIRPAHPPATNPTPKAG